MRSRRLLALLTAIAAMTVTLLGAPPAAAAGRGSTIIVALGDSAASGEGAGDYEPGTRGENGDWCHRSVHAYVHGTSLAEKSVNLACSGATSADVGLGAEPHYTERSQAQRLAKIAARYRVTTVIVQVGANDDAALVATGVACIRALLDPREPPCRDTIGPLVPERMAATAPKVEAAVRDVREAMGSAGYSDEHYDLVLASYASPFTEKMVPLHGLRGCPYGRPDAEWSRTVLFPALSESLRGVAERTGARFLDLVRATEGYEACSRTPWTQEWQRRLTVNAQALVYGGLDAIGYHIAQESFHPNATGHAEMARCIDEFVRSGAASSACVVGADGHLQLDDAAPVPAPAA
ncbi:MAG: GDSL-type esterase/lipase family protein [Pseudonocardia sp.]